MKTRVIALIGLLLTAWVGVVPVSATPTGSVLAAGQTAPAPPTQDFQDVPTSSTFYTYVHNLFVDGVVGGYTCGGPFEPCVPPANLPYFRPGANVTRGQNSKFTDNGRRLITGPHTGGTAPGLFSALNTDESSSSNAAVYGHGATAIWGASESTGLSDGYGGFFYNSGGGSGQQYGALGYAVAGVGLGGISQAAGGPLGSAGVTGLSTATGGLGGVFTGTTGVLGSTTAASYADGVIGFVANSNCSPYCQGVYARETGDNGYALYASVANTGHPNDYGARITNYNLGTTALGLQVIGTALATGGYSTGGSYQMVVRYNGSADLHPGDVLALDGNNITLDGASVFGTVQADGSNAAIGVAQYRFQVFDMPARPGDAVHAAEPAHHNLQADEKATTFKTGDYIELVVLGQAQMKPSGAVSVGDRLTVNSDGSVTATKDAAVSIGRVGGKPDKDGYVSVFVNFK